MHGATIRFTVIIKEYLQIKTPGKHIETLNEKAVNKL